MDTAPIKSGQVVMWRGPLNTGDAEYWIPAIVLVTHEDWVPGYHAADTGDWIPTKEPAQPKRGCAHLVSFGIDGTKPLVELQLDVPEGTGPGTWKRV